MTANDELVDRWFIKRWTTSRNGGFDPSYDERKHGSVEELQVVTVDAGWECNCYSEFTRNDLEVLTASVRTKSGSVEIRYATYGSLPDIMADIIDFGILEDVCFVERDYAENEY